jgi:hypothetical protein
MIETVAGDAFINEIVRTHAIYAQVLGITKLSPEAQVPVRAELMRQLRRSTNTYVFHVLALAGDEGAMPEVRQVLQPRRWASHSSISSGPISDGSMRADHASLAP